MLLGAVAFLLLVVAANVLHLLLTRTASRSREVALRMALGAGRSRVVRELVLETLLLSGVAAVTGAVLAAWSVGIMQTLAPESLPRVSELSVGWPVLLFGGAVALAISIAIGVVAARHGRARTCTACFARSSGRYDGWPPRGCVRRSSSAKSASRWSC